MGVGLMWFITIMFLITIVGFAGGIFVYALKLVLHSEDAYTIDPVPPQSEN